MYPHSEIWNEQRYKWHLLKLIWDLWESGYIGKGVWRHFLCYIKPSPQLFGENCFGVSFCGLKSETFEVSRQWSNFLFISGVDQLINLSTLNINPVFVPLCSPIFGVPLQQTKAGFVPAPRAPGPRSGMWQLLFLAANPGISILRVTPPSLRAIFLFLVIFFVLGCSWQMVATRCKKIIFFKKVGASCTAGWGMSPGCWYRLATHPLTTSCCNTCFFNILNFLLFFFHLYCWMCNFVL